MPDRPQRRLAAILSADAAGYSRLMADDESATVATLERYRGIMGSAVAQHEGRVVDAPGDNLLAEFPTATEAVLCAVEVQHRLAKHNAALAKRRRMDFRIGIHLGEIREQGGRLYGDGINIAARLESLAEAGGVSVSSAVHEQVQGKSRLIFADQGEQRLKNIPRPIRMYRVRWEPAELPGPASADTPNPTPAVAVLPFANLSADPDQEFFADGMTEEIINALSQVKGLRVIARTSTFSFKGAGADIATIGAKLHATAVVEGSVRRVGDRVRITAQLTDVAGGHHLWSERYDRSLADIFEIQDEIAATVVRTIRPKLLDTLGGRLVTRPTDNQEAYELYLRASERLARINHWDTHKAIEMLRGATGLDPRYADAWARLGNACCQMSFSFEPEAGWHERAEDAVRRAFALEAENAEANFAQGLLLWNPRAGFRHRPTLRALQRALAAQPGLHRARVWRGIVLLHVGLFEEAEQDVREALAAEPENAHALNMMGQLSAFRGRPEEAEDWYNRSESIDPDFDYNLLFRPAARIRRDDLAGAESDLTRARQIVKDDPFLDSNEALLWAVRGETAKAEAAIARASQERPSRGHIHHTWHHSALAHALLGQPRAAVEKLRRAAATGFPNYPLFSRDPVFAALRDDREMRTLLAELEREFDAYCSEFGDRD